MNNYQKHLKQLQDLKGRPELLIHICCGVCSVYPLLHLRKYFNITILFTNSNIYPHEEYLRRLEALESYLDYLNDSCIKLVVDKYDNKTYAELMTPLANEKEGGKRCYYCYQYRLEETFKYAKEHHFDYCTTVMSISNRKNADWLNEIGEKLENKYQVKYLYADFKKGDGITLNDKLNKELKLYHQDYCGCIYSMKN